MLLQNDPPVIVDDDGTVWYTATIEIGDSGGIMHYVRGFADNFKPPAWAYSYSAGTLIHNNGPQLVGICTFRVSAGGLHEGIIATTNGAFVDDAIVKIVGTTYTPTQFYNYCNDHQGQIVQIQYTIPATQSIEQAE